MAVARRVRLVVVLTLLTAACRTKREPPQEAHPSTAPAAPSGAGKAQADSTISAATPPLPTKAEDAPPPDSGPRAASFGVVTVQPRLVEEPLAPHCMARLTAPEFTGFAEPKLAEKLNGQIRAEFAAMRKSLFDDSPCVGATEQVPYGFEATYELGAAHENIVALELTASAYTGGAHPNGLTHCYVVLLREGRLEQLNPQLTPHGRSELSERTQRRLAEEHGVERLTDAGFFVSQVRIQHPAGICLTEKGVRVIFQQYEVAPYALGVPSVAFSFDEVRSSFKPGTLPTMTKP